MPVAPAACILGCWLAGHLGGIVLEADDPMLLLVVAVAADDLPEPRRPLSQQAMPPPTHTLRRRSASGMVAKRGSLLRWMRAAEWQMTHLNVRI